MPYVFFNSKSIKKENLYLLGKKKHVGNFDIC